MARPAMHEPEQPTLPTELRWPIREDLPGPGPAAVRVWCVPLRCDPRRLSDWRSVLSGEELDRAGRFRTEVLAHRYLVSRVMLRRVLGAAMNLAPERVAFGREARGKPCLVDPAGIGFNLAHTGDLMLLAVTPGVPVGVDIERVRRLKAAQDIARRFFTGREAGWLRAFEGAAVDRAFFRLWTRKEAVLKATGEGISSGLGTFEVLEANGEFTSTLSRRVPGEEEDRWEVTELSPADGFIAAVALPASDGWMKLECACHRLG